MSDFTEFGESIFAGELRVLGHCISVYVAEMGPNLCGQSDPVEKYICIGYNKNQDVVASTFWHEVFHIVLGLAGTAHLLGNGEEPAVIALENGLSPMLRLLLPPSPKKKRKAQPKLSPTEQIQSDSIDTIIAILNAVNE